MPTIRDIPGPYRNFFYSMDCQEPPHVHVERDRSTCKWWLHTLSIARSHGFPPHELRRIRRAIFENRVRLLEHGMSTVGGRDVRPRITAVTVDAERIAAHLADGRIISIPLRWSSRLQAATPAQRARFRIIGDGEGVHWPDVDEDISVEGMLAGWSAAVGA